MLSLMAVAEAELNGVACPAGYHKYEEQQGQEACKACKAGQYQPLEGQAGCKMCSAGSFYPPASKFTTAASASMSSTLEDYVASICIDSRVEGFCHTKKWS